MSDREPANGWRSYDAPDVDYADVQGLVRFGYGRMTEASYALLRVKDAAAARAWLRSRARHERGHHDPPPPTAHAGGVHRAPASRRSACRRRCSPRFSPEFLAGMTEAQPFAAPGRRREPTRPSGGNGAVAAGVPHLLVMFFAEPGAPRGLRAADDRRGVERRRSTRCTARHGGSGRHRAVRLRRRHQPAADRLGRSSATLDGRAQSTTATSSRSASSCSAIANEYGKYTDRPLLDADAASAGLPPAEDAPEKKDVGRNGTYLVMRQLRQDVRRLLAVRLPAEPAAIPREAEKLAAALVGRTRGGRSRWCRLQRACDSRASDRSPRKFARISSRSMRTRRASRCPFGAHVRRANPRNARLPRAPDRPGAPHRDCWASVREGFRDDLMSSVRFHRILRRGREYGPGLSPDGRAAPAPTDDPERGLHFICLNANISRQFEFLQNAWMMSTKFSGLTGESDPLIGNRERDPGLPGHRRRSSMPHDGGLRRRVSGLPQFVTVRGGAYFFLPGLRALRYIAKAH